MERGAPLGRKSKILLQDEEEYQEKAEWSSSAKA